VTRTTSNGRSTTINLTDQISQTSAAAWRPHYFSAALTRRVRPQNRMSMSCTLPIKAIPNAPRSAVVGWLGDALKVKVHALPSKAAPTTSSANSFADTLALPRRAVTVLQGDKSRQKVLHIAGLTLPAVKARLAAAGAV